jgi:hypothetical protein
MLHGGANRDRLRGPDNTMELLDEESNVVGTFVGRHAGDDLIGGGVYSDMNLPPRSACATVLLFCPLALREQLEACTIGNQMRTLVRTVCGCWSANSPLQLLRVMWSGTASSSLNSWSTLPPNAPA